MIVDDCICKYCSNYQRVYRYILFYDWSVYVIGFLFFCAPHQFINDIWMFYLCSQDSLLNWIIMRLPKCTRIHILLTINVLLKPKISYWSQCQTYYFVYTVFFQFSIFVVISIFILVHTSPLKPFFCGKPIDTLYNNTRTRNAVVRHSRYTTNYLCKYLFIQLYVNH